MGADDNIRSYFSNHLQPPLVLPRRGDAGYSVIVFPLMLLRYCIFYAGHFAIVFPQQSSTAIAVCPSPTGEVRWGLMTIFGVTPLIIFGPLSFSPVGEMQGYSVTVFPLRLLRYCLSSEVTPLLSYL